MKLPDELERELQAIEADYAARGGQQAGASRLRGLRAALDAIPATVGYIAPAVAICSQPCAVCGTTTSDDGDWYRMCGPCRWK